MWPLILSISSIHRTQPKWAFSQVDGLATLAFLVPDKPRLLTLIVEGIALRLSRERSRSPEVRLRVRGGPPHTRFTPS